jgi:hypothetical protein
VRKCNSFASPLPSLTQLPLSRTTRRQRQLLWLTLKSRSPLLLGVYCIDGFRWRSSRVKSSSWRGKCACSTSCRCTSCERTGAVGGGRRRCDGGGQVRGAAAESAGLRGRAGQASHVTRHSPPISHTYMMDNCCQECAFNDVDGRDACALHLLLQHKVPSPPPLPSAVPSASPITGHGPGSRVLPSVRPRCCR